MKNVRDFEMFWDSDKECYLIRVTDAILIEDQRDFANAELLAAKKELAEVKEKLHALETSPEHGFHDAAMLLLALNISNEELATAKAKLASWDSAIAKLQFMDEMQRNKT